MEKRGVRGESDKPITRRSHEQSVCIACAAEMRELRKSRTETEKRLWQALRNRGLCGLKFTRQHPLFIARGRERRYYIADFYCHERSLVLEIDGPVHDRTRDRDHDRDQLIGLLGLRVLRVKNDEVLGDFDGVLKKIRNCVETSASHEPLPWKEGPQ